MDKTICAPRRAQSAHLKRQDFPAEPAGQRTSLRRAIDGMCRSCIYDPKSGLGTWRQQTEGCTIRSCALWPVRPARVPRERLALPIGGAVTGQSLEVQP
jgi:hypothetical protein